MKKTGMIMALLVVTCWSAADVAVAGRRAGHHFTPQQRIRQGIASGELTRFEAGRLKRELAGIRLHRRRALADHRLTHRERIRLRRESRMVDSHIYRLKHNNMKRKPSQGTESVLVSTCSHTLCTAHRSMPRISGTL